MEQFRTEPLYSRQGRASIHMHPILFPTSKRSVHSRPTVTEGYNVSTPQKAGCQLSASFQTVSREQYQNTHRNRTGSPGPSRYSPKLSLIGPRSDKSPRYRTDQTTPRKQIVYLPPCVDASLACSLHKRKARTAAREAVSLDDWTQHVETHHSKRSVPKQFKRLIGVRKFATVKGREPFVKTSDPPHPGRFDFDFPESNVCSRNKRVHTVDFAKTLPRPPLFKPGLNLEPYDRNEEAVLRPLNANYASFDKSQGHEPLLLEHMLHTPLSVDLPLLDSAFNKQSTVRGIVQSPRLNTVSPRHEQGSRERGILLQGIRN